MIEIFFYGLFMDIDLLSRNRLDPKNPRQGYLQNYALKIGNRASLIPSKGDRSYGLLISVNGDRIHKLYAEPSVADYIPEEVEIHLENNETVKAICYNLPLELLTGTNESYAKSLFNLAKGLGFPVEYLEKIQ